MSQSRETVLINSASLKSLVESRGVKRDRLANRLGVSRITVSRWINGHVKRIHRNNLHGLTDALQCRIEEITFSQVDGAGLDQRTLDFLESSEYQDLVLEFFSSEINDDLEALARSIPRRMKISHLARITSFLKSAGRWKLGYFCHQLAQSLIENEEDNSLFQEVSIQMVFNRIPYLTVKEGICLLEEFLGVGSQLLQFQVMSKLARLSRELGDFYHGKKYSEASFELLENIKREISLQNFLEERAYLLLEIGDEKLLYSSIDLWLSRFNNVEINHEFWFELKNTLALHFEGKLSTLPSRFLDEQNFRQLGLISELAARSSNVNLVKEVLELLNRKHQVPMDSLIVDFYKALLLKKLGEGDDSKHFLSSALAISKQIEVRMRIPLLKEKYQSCSCISQ